MEFPIAGVTVNPILLAGIGFLVGIIVYLFIKVLYIFL